MPLMILGLLLLIGLLALSIVKYVNSAEEDTRNVRERYPHAFSVNDNPESGDSDGAENSSAAHNEEPADTDSYYDEDSFRGDIDHMIRTVTEDLRKRTKDINLDLSGIRDFMRKIDTPPEKEDNTVEFPKENIENEKRKRGIHSDK